MAPRKRKNADSEDASEIQAAKYRGLMQRYKIRFLGYDSRWPTEHAEIFKTIKEIGREQYATYQASATRDGLTVAQTKKRVTEVVKAASHDYEIGANEETLRLHTEPLVFKRFESEVKCSKCQKQLWISEFAASSDTPPQTERLRPRRTDMLLCTCSPEEVFTDNQFPDPSNTSIFSDRCSHTIEHHRDDKIPGHDIPCQKPDRVFGLRTTESIRHYTQQWPNLKHTPLVDTHDLVYPFLISEAKASGNNPGFGNIDAQTAFPIRACLKLQKRLRDASPVPLNPLVWYMPYQGDIWRLSACVIHDEEVRVYSLWMGCTQDRDHALQLLCIIDYIVHWARFTFRSTILACLARSWDSVLRQTPGESLNRDLMNASQSSGLPLMPIIVEEPRETEDTVMDDRDRDEDLSYSERENTPSSQSTENLNLILTHNNLGLSVDIENRTVIRCADQVKFEFELLRLPERTSLLGELLRRTFSRPPSESDVRKRAQELLDMLFLQKLALSLDSTLISLLENEWLRTENAITPTSTKSDSVVRAWTSFESSFDPETWHIVRRLSCISCSRNAAVSLSYIAGTAQPLWNDISDDFLVSFGHTRDAITCLRRLPNGYSVPSALQNFSFRLSFSQATASCRWELANDNVAIDCTNALRNNHTGTPHEIFQRNVKYVELFSTSAHCERMLPPGLDFGTLEDALLLKKPDYWPQDSADWCLLTLYEQNSSQDVTYEDLITDAIDQRQIYQLGTVRNDSLMEPYLLHDQDEQFLHVWKRTLSNSDSP